MRACVFLDTRKTVTVSLLAKYFITQMYLLRRDRGKATQTENKFIICPTWQRAVTQYKITLRFLLFKTRTSLMN